MKTRQRILIDMDNTICDWDEPIFKAIPSLDRSKYTSWDIVSCYPDHSDEILDIMKSKGYYEHLTPYDNAIKFIKSLTENFDIYFLTANPAPNMYAFSEKADWIEHHFGQEYVPKLIICKDKFLVKGDVLIDDKPNITNNESSWVHLLYSRPYNDGVFTWTKNLHVLFDLLKCVKKQNCTPV